MTIFNVRLLFFIDKNNKKTDNNKKGDTMKKLSPPVIFAAVIIVFGLIFIGLLNSKSQKTEKIDNGNSSTVKTRINTESRVGELNILRKKTTKYPGQQFHFTIYRDVKFSSGMKDVELSFKIPVSIPNRQNITNISVSPSPSKISKDVDGEYVYINLPSPPERLTIVVEGDAAVYPYNLKIAKTGNKNPDGILPEDDRKMYLANEEKINVNSKYLRKVASKSIANADNDVDTVKNIFDYVVEHLRYEPMDTGKNKGAYQALLSGSGVCEEFSHLFVTLCRIKKIPAKIREGFTIPFTDELQDSYKGHAWAEVYFDNYGWVTFDPTNKMSEKIMEKAASFSVLPYDFISKITEDRLYLIADMNQIFVEYAGDGNVISENLVIKFD